MTGVQTCALPILYRVYGIKFEEEIDDERKNEELEKEKNYG